jgi:hypothetical protein
VAKLDVTYAYAADITKSERDPETGDLMVYGKATGPDLDLDGQVCDSDWLKTAMPAWFEWGNVREMHGAVAAGIGVELDGDDAANYMLLSRCVDKGAAEKVEKKVYKGYSIGIKNARVVKDVKAPGGRIVDGEIVEVSYVDRPCNPTAKMAIAKSAGLAEDGGSIEIEDGDDASLQPVAVEPEVLPEDAPVVEDVPKAGAWAKSVGADLLRRVRRLVPADALIVKASTDADITTAGQAITIIAQLIESEAGSLAVGNLCDAEQIACLLRAVDALAWFQCMEAAEPASADVPTDDMDMNGAVVEMSTVAEINKGATIEPETTDQLVKAAVTEAMKAHEAEIATLRAELAKVSRLPAPGGPVLARPRAVIAAAGEREAALAKAEQFDSMSKMFSVTDPAAARGYAQLAADARRSVKETDHEGNPSTV